MFVLMLASAVHTRGLVELALFHAEPWLVAGWPHLRFTWHSFQINLAFTWPLLAFNDFQRLSFWWDGGRKAFCRSVTHISSWCGTHLHSQEAAGARLGLMCDKDGQWTEGSLISLDIPWHHDDHLLQIDEDFQQPGSFLLFLSGEEACCQVLASTNSSFPSWQHSIQMHSMHSLEYGVQKRNASPIDSGRKERTGCRFQCFPRGEGQSASELLACRCVAVGITNIINMRTFNLYHQNQWQSVSLVGCVPHEQVLDYRLSIDWRAWAHTGAVHYNCRSYNYSDMFSRVILHTLLYNVHMTE